MINMIESGEFVVIVAEIIIYMMMIILYRILTGKYEKNNSNNKTIYQVANLLFQVKSIYY
jgi:hypothetical protein